MQRRLPHPAEGVIAGPCRGADGVVCAHIFSRFSAPLMLAGSNMVLTYTCTTHTEVMSWHETRQRSLSRVAHCDRTETTSNNTVKPRLHSGRCRPPVLHKHSCTMQQYIPTQSQDKQPFPSSRRHIRAAPNKPAHTHTHRHHRAAPQALVHLQGDSHRSAAPQPPLQHSRILACSTGTNQTLMQITCHLLRRSAEGVAVGDLQLHTVNLLVTSSSMMTMMGMKWPTSTLPSFQFNLCSLASSGVLLPGAQCGALIRMFSSNTAHRAADGRAFKAEYPSTGVGLWCAQTSLYKHQEYTPLDGYTVHSPVHAAMVGGRGHRG